ncbi:MAG: hypothetical protein ABI472_03475 [Ginsengibacter sp.]
MKKKTKSAASPTAAIKNKQTAAKTSTAATKKASSKKAPSKKAPPKKAPTKKVSPQKVAAQKASPKKASPKKAAAKKAPLPKAAPPKAPQPPIPSTGKVPVLKKIVAAQPGPLAIEQALKYAEYQLKKAGIKSFQLQDVSEAPRAALQAVSLKKPVEKKAGRVKAVATRPVPEEKQAFTGRAMAFGNAEVPTLSIVSQDQNDLNLQVKVNDFTFDDIFVDFNSPAKSFFVFDDVNIHLRQQISGDAITSTMRFNGTLRMNQEPLTTLKNFLKCDEGLMVAGEIDTTVTDISQKIAPGKVELISAGQFLLPLAEGIILKSAELKILLEKEDDQWVFTETVNAVLEINKLGTSPVELNATVTYNNGTLNVVAEADAISGLFDIEKLNLSDLKLEFNIGEENDISVSGKFIPGNTTYKLSGKISSGFTGLLASASSFTLANLNTLFTYFSNDILSLPSYDMTFENVFIGFANADGTLDERDLKKGFSIGGSVKAYDYTISATTQISNDGVEFSGSAGNIVIGPVNIIKTALALNLYTTASKKQASFSLMGETVIEGITLDCKVAYEKITDGTSNTLIYAAIQANSFSLGTVFPAAKNTFVDSLKFSKAAFIYSSTDTETKDEDFNFHVKQGLTLSAVLEEVPALSSLTKQKSVGLVLSAHYGQTTDISIEIPDTRLNLGSSVTCDALQLGIQILPTPALQMLFGMNVQVPKQDNPLHFDLVLEIGITDARGSATMKGYWVEPFGVRGLQIGPELALQLGIIYASFAATGLPSEFGFAGGIVLGDVSGRLAVSVSENPMHEILMGEIDKLSPQNLVAFAEKLTNISLDSQNVPNFFDIEKLKLYCAPAGGSIGTITFEPGFSFVADMVLFGKRINIYTLFNDSGIVAKGELDTIEIGPLKITGSNGGNAKLDLELTTEKQSVYLDCAFEFLGIGESIFLDVSNQGASFMLEQTFVDLLTYKIIAKTAGSFEDLAKLDFSLYAEFENELTDYIKTTVVDKINDARSAVDVSITEARKKVNDAEKAYLALFTPAQNKLNQAQTDADRYLAQCTKEVNDQKAVWEAKVNTAQNAVNKARADLDNAINDARNKVAQAENAYNQAMRNAQDTVNTEQVKYNAAFNKAKADADQAINDYNNSFGKAYSDLRSAQDTVNSLQSDINYCQSKIDGLAWYEKPAAIYWGSRLAAVWLSMNAAKGVLAACQAIVNGFQSSSVAVARATTQGTLNAIQTTGMLALNAAKGTLEAIRYGGGYVAIQTAQQALNTAQLTGQASLNAANGTLTAAQTTGRSLLSAAEFTLQNVGNSAVYIALETAKASLEIIKKGSAAVAFESAKGVLEGARQGTEGILSLSAYIASHIGDLLEVRKITLAASLKGIESGRFFIATFDGSVLSQNFHCTLDFNVKNASAFVEDLFKNVLAEAKKIAM